MRITVTLGKIGENRNWKGVLQRRIIAIVSYGVSIQYHFFSCVIENIATIWHFKIALRFDYSLGEAFG